MSRSWAKGSTRQWRAVRARVLAENRGAPHYGRCALGVDGVCTGGEATHVHHVVGRTVSGDDPRFLVATCSACNLHVGEPAKHSPKPKRISSWTSRAW